MKKLLLSFLLALFTTAAYCQGFAPVGSTWYYTNIEGISTPTRGYEKIECVGEVMMQGKMCRQLKRTLFRTWTTPQQLQDMYVYSSGDTVFSLGSDGAFYVHFNFGAQVGDTWTTLVKDHTNANVLVTFQVTETSTIVVNGQVLRTLKIVPVQSYMSYGLGTITEKLGSDVYMLPQNFAFHDDELKTELRCYSDPAFGSYQAATVNSCTEMITAAPKDVQVAHFKLYPNPSSGSFQLDFSPTFGAKTVEIINSLGQLVYRQQIAENTPSTLLSLDKSGVYLCRVSTGQGLSFSSRLVIE